jgi:hypothetical protein
MLVQDARNGCNGTDLELGVIMLKKKEEENAD